MNYYDITVRFYDRWLGVDGAFTGNAGVRFVYSAERNVKQYGYPCVFDVFALVKGDEAVISYGDGATDRIDALRSELGDAAGVEELKAALEKVYGVKAAHSVKFVYTGGCDAETTARPLAAEDMEAYIDFFAAAHPGSETDWIREYFDEMVDDGGTFCVFDGGRIVSVADAPGMPYMADETQEIGVATRLECRRRGFALDACAAAAKRHVANGKCPIWSAAWDNFASHRLAERVGFEKFADAVMLSLK